MRHYPGSSLPSLWQRGRLFWMTSALAPKRRINDNLQRHGKPSGSGVERVPVGLHLGMRGGFLVNGAAVHVLRQVGDNLGEVVDGLSSCRSDGSRIPCSNAAARPPSGLPSPVRPRRRRTP